MVISGYQLFNFSCREQEGFRSRGSSPAHGSIVFARAEMLLLTSARFPMVRKSSRPGQRYFRKQGSDAAEGRRFLNAWSLLSSVFLLISM
jgi:hypothetical protein